MQLTRGRGNRHKTTEQRVDKYYYDRCWCAWEKGRNTRGQRELEKRSRWREESVALGWVCWENAIWGKWRELVTEESAWRKSIPGGGISRARALRWKLIWDSGETARRSVSWNRVSEGRIQGIKWDAEQDSDTLRPFKPWSGFWVLFFIVLKGIYLVVQWLRLHAYNAGDSSSVLVRKLDPACCN